jgi:hypothetical protein
MVMTWKRAWRWLRITIALALATWLFIWLSSPIRGFAITAGLLVADRLLLLMERRRWINYRRRGLSRGAATYHTLEFSAAFDPGFHEVMDVKYASEKEQDDAGGPPGRDDIAPPQ